MLNLNELNVFLTAIECGNFSRAARKLHLSQPAISQTIDSLEKHFGVLLFVRQGRSVRLTDAGQMLKPMARELLVAARRLEETMTSLQGEVIGEMNVGCSTASGKYLLPGLIVRYRAKFPQVKVNVLIHSRSEVIDQLIAGEISMGVSSSLVEHRDLEYQDFFRDEIILIVPSNHRWAGYGRILPDDLLDEPIILREEEAGTRAVQLDGLRKHDILPDMLKVEMVLGNAEAIEMAVEEGIGVSFVSRLAASRGLALGRIKEIEVEGLPLYRKIYLARNRRFPATRAQSEFWNFVRSPAVEVDEPWSTPQSP